jgi:hypothetical protein
VLDCCKISFEGFWEQMGTFTGGDVRKRDDLCPHAANVEQSEIAVAVSLVIEGLH